MTQGEKLAFIRDPERLSKRKLSEFIALWWQLFGRNRNYANRRLSAVNCTCQDMGDPMIYQINARCLIDYRAYRLEQGSKVSTINHDLFGLSEVFEAMAEIDEFHGENPVAAISALKEPKTEISYFTQSEVDRLLSLCSGDFIASPFCYLYPVGGRLST